MMLRFVLSLCLLVVPHTLSASSLQTSAGPVLVTQIMGDLSEPWGLDFLPGGGFVVTERQGNLVLVTADGKRRDLGGVPKVVAKGAGRRVGCFRRTGFCNKPRVISKLREGARARRGNSIGHSAAFAG